MVKGSVLDSLSEKWYKGSVLGLLSEKWYAGAPPRIIIAKRRPCIVEVNKNLLLNLPFLPIMLKNYQKIFRFPNF